jgi:hypothetical protein
MKHISELERILSGFLNWNKARLDCFSKMLLALFAVRTVNLREIAVALNSDAQLDSRYKRLKRFFSQISIDKVAICRWMFRLFFSDKDKCYFTIDRTNWFFGKAKINILMVGVAYEGIAIPLYWTLLKKAGSASAEEHLTILEKVFTIFDSTQCAGILGDREFASHELFNWLNNKKLPFYIRIKDNSQAFIGNKKFREVAKLFNKLNPKESSVFQMEILLYGEPVFLAGARSERGELMVVATNRDPRNAISIYLRRWEIETLFQSLKGRGFRFEDTHLTKLERIDRLVVLLTVGFALAHKVGEWVARKKPIPFNKHRDSRRPQYSFFRYGLDKIREAILGHGSRKKVLSNYFHHVIGPIITDDIPLLTSIVEEIW